MSVEGSSDGESFRLYPREVLCPALGRGQVVVMDDLSVHKSRAARELIEERGREPWFLPAYSPDFNPKEEAFCKISTLRGKRKPERTLEAHFEATHLALSAVTVGDANGFFSHCGYGTPRAHSL